MYVCLHVRMYVFVCRALALYHFVSCSLSRLPTAQVARPRLVCVCCVCLAYSAIPCIARVSVLSAGESIRQRGLIYTAFRRQSRAGACLPLRGKHDSNLRHRTPCHLARGDKGVPTLYTLGAPSRNLREKTTEGQIWSSNKRSLRRECAWLLHNHCKCVEPYWVSF